MNLIEESMQSLMKHLREVKMINKDGLLDKVSSAIFGISIVATLVLLGWFNLTIISGLIAITFSGFVASILSLLLKIYLYR